MTAEQLEQTIRNEIPALKGAAFHIDATTANSVEVSARLRDHLNHKGTVFGGSLYQVALVASYGLFLKIIEESPTPTRDFVIAKGQMSYRAPVTRDFTARCEVTSEQIRDFANDLKSKRKADLLLKTSIHCQGQECARLEARFVAFFPPRPRP
jgi:thioesterase domain-containing protein